jgi:hypothetical protein
MELIERFKNATATEQNAFLKFIRENKEINISDYDIFPKVVTFRANSQSR